jgi:flavin reductase (DIM6/NTAB) family NADH-FMN oxidoreductase RutF
MKPETKLEDMLMKPETNLEDLLMKPETNPSAHSGERSFAWIPKGGTAGTTTASNPSAYLSAEQAMDAFRSAMRRLAGAVNLVTTRNGDERCGLTATAVCSLTANPPRLLACINLGGRSYQSIANSRCMAINVLASQHRSLALDFASKECDDPFAQGDQWTHAATGAPILTDALASFDCEVEQMMVTTTHAIVIGEIRHVSYGDGGQPLLYLDGNFMTSAEMDDAV